MATTFTTRILKDQEKNATGIPVPAAVIEALQAGKRPRVKVTLNGYTYTTTVGVMDGVAMLALSAERRQAAGVQGGDSVEVTLELDTAPRTVDVPADLAEALAQTLAASAAFAAAAFSARKEFVRQVESAKAPKTRTRRIAAIVTKLSGG